MPKSELTRQKDNEVEFGQPRHYLALGLLIYLCR